MTPTSAPVVLGSGFSGLLVSHALARAGVAHVLIGAGEPPEIPRLGESMIEVSGPEIWRTLGPDFRKHFWKKNHISLYDGDYASMACTGDPRETLEEQIAHVVRGDRVRLPWLRTLLFHVDRTRLDIELYRRVVAHPTCRFTTSLVAETVHDPATDRIARLVLADGTVLERPAFVFDATGFRGVAARAAGVGMAATSNEQRVVWEHGHRDAGGDRSAWWHHGTNLVRLRADLDGIAGISWIIPLGDVISAGVSVDAADAEQLDDGAVIDLLAAAAARRGLDYRAAYPRQTAPVALRHRYFQRDRAHGANWLLVGGTYATYWFPSSTGVHTAAMAAAIAPRVLDGDAGALCHHYRRSLDWLANIHVHLEQMTHGPGLGRRRDVMWFWSRWLAYIPRRLSDYFRVANQDYDRRRFRHSLLRRGSRICLRLPRLQMLFWNNVVTRVVKAPLAEQTARLAPDYDHQKRYRLRNWLRSLPATLWPPRGWPRGWTLAGLKAAAAENRPGADDQPTDSMRSTGTSARARMASGTSTTPERSRSAT